MKKYLYIGSLILFASFVVLSGCHKTTVISREDQIGLMQDTTASATAYNSTAVVDSESTAAASEETPETDTTLPDTTDAEAAVSPKVSAPPSSDSQKPTETTPAVSPETTAPKATKPKEPVVTTTPETTAVPTVTDTHTQPEETTENTAPPDTTAAPADDPYDLSNHSVGSTEYGIHAAMNAERTAAGVSELTLDGYLCAIASVRAYEASQYWSHNRLDGSSCFTVLSDYGYAYTTAAENLAQAGIGTGADTYVYLWANSEGHRDNMLNPEFTRTGIGVYDYNGMTYVACLYAG